MAPITAMPPDTMVRAATPPTVSLEVEPAGIVEDLLSGIALVGATGGMAADVILSGIGAIPRYFATAVGAGIAEPGAIPSLLSALVHLAFAPPGVDSPTSFIKQLTPHLAAFTGLLPEPLAELANQVSGGINELIASFLGFLPDPAAGFAALVPGEPLPGLIGDVIGNIEALAEGLGESVSNTLAALGGMPMMLAATFGAAIDDPSRIPGLLSNLVYGVFAPEQSLIAGLINPLVDAVAGVPLVGGLVDGARDLFFDVASSFLGLLPTPDNPLEAEVPDAGLNSVGLMAAPLALGDLGDLIPGGLLPGIGDFEAVVDAMSTAVRDFVGGIGQVPELLGNAVRAVVANPMDFGKVLVTVLDTAMNSARAGFQPIVAAVLNLLPEVIRTPLNQIGQTLDGVVKSGQEAALEFVGGPADLSGGAGDGGGDGAGVGAAGEKVQALDDGEGTNGASKADEKEQVVTAIQVSNEGGVNDITLTETKVITLDVIPEAKNAAETLKVGAQVSKKPVMNELRTNGPEAPSTTVGGGDTGASLGGDDDGDGDGTGGGLAKGSESGGGAGTGTGAGDGGSGGGDDD